MKCDVCKRSTDWDESYGKSNFIICPTCFERLAKAIEKEDKNLIMNIIFEIADIREEKVD